MDNIEQEITSYFAKVNKTLENCNKENIKTFISLLLLTYDKNGTVFLFGNGGSGGTASHFCADFLKGISCGLSKRFKAVCLNDNVQTLMAIANDISYEEVFVEQLKNFLTKDDLVIGISGSGNSMNVVKAIRYAFDVGAKTVAFCGFDGGKIKDMSYLAIQANIDDMEVSEDVHLIVIHCVKQILIKRLHSKTEG